MPRRPCIIGCGAMGGLLALQLYRATGQPPICVTRRGPSGRTVLTVWERGSRVEVPVVLRPVRAPPGECAWAVVAVKYWDLEGALLAARESGARRVWMLLNGLLGEEEARRLGLEPRFIVSTYGATRLGPLEVRLAGEGEHIIGAPGRLDADSCQLATLLRAGMARARCTERINYYRWVKAAVNAAINGVASVLDAPNGVVVENPHARHVAMMAAREAARSARCRGVPLGDEEAEEWVSRVAEATRDNVSSMLQDLRGCRRTEAPAIYEPILEGPCGEGLGTIETLYMLVRAIEEGGLRCRRGRRSRPGASPG